MHHLMTFLAKKSVGRAIALLLILMSGPVSGGGGDWKMGPFGPYWDDNSWPEFTPMYWMEEFMNRLDDDDDEIQNWMLRNQFPGSTGLPGAYPQNSWQSNAWSPNVNRGYQPYGNVPGNTYIFRGGQFTQRLPDDEPGPLPNLTPEEFARMPVDLQREYKRALDEQYPVIVKPLSGNKRRPLPNLTPEEFARMPADLQREYERAFDREYSEGSRRSFSRQQQSLPSLTSREYARMPVDLQREYKRAFDREHGEERFSTYTERERLPRLTPEEYAHMPADLQREYQRAFEREYGEYQARQRDVRRRRSLSEGGYANPPARAYK